MTSLARTMGFATRDRGGRVLSSALVAGLALHGAFAVALGTQPRAQAAPVAPPTEIDFEPAPEPEPVPAPAPAPAPEPDSKQPAPAAKPLTAPAPKAAAPAAAKAGALLTAKSAAAEEPVSFVTDPDGTTYGSGVVAKAGTAEVGAEGAQAGGVPSGTGTAPAAPKVVGSGTGDAIVPASDLSRGPALREPDACKGYFPSSADDDVATVSVTVVIKPNGDVASASVVFESPKGQGFGAAARSCLLGKRFDPGLDVNGKAVTTSTKVTVRFSR